MVGSLEQLRFEDLAGFELGQFFKRHFRAAYFKGFRRLGETLKSCSDRKHNNKKLQWNYAFYSVPIHGPDADTKSSAICEELKQCIFSALASRSAASLPG